MSWVSGRLTSNDSIIGGLPYPTSMTVIPIDSISYVNIKFRSSLSPDIFGLPKSISNPATITIPGSFRGCSNLTSVTIPQSVKYIDYYAFWGTGLTAVTIASDCVYNDFSFPTGCVISRYS